jgi:hypothetical protein
MQQRPPLDRCKHGVERASRELPGGGGIRRSTEDRRFSRGNDKIAVQNPRVDQMNAAAGPKR